MSKFRTSTLLFLLSVAFACRSAQPKDDPSIWKKVNINFSRLDENGLAGPPSGKVVVNYEYCIPATAAAWRLVQKTDPTATKNAGAGRIGCAKNEWLVIGSTHQPNYKKVVYELARLDFVKSVNEVFWE